MLVLVAQSCPTLCDPMDCSPPGSSVHEIFQARILEWVAISFSRGSSQPRDWTQVSCTAGRFFTDWATREAQECSKYHTTALISHASKVMLKILQARLQKYMNCEPPDLQAGFKKGRGTRDQIPNIHWIIEKSKRVPEKHLFLFYWLCQSLRLCGSQLWKILQEMGLPDHLTCLLRNLYAGQEATVRTGHGKTDWFQIGKGVCQGYILSPCLFNLDAEYILQNSRLDEGQLESRLLGKWHHPYGRKWRRTKEPFDESEREE